MDDLPSRRARTERAPSSALDLVYPPRPIEALAIAILQSLEDVEGRTLFYVARDAARAAMLARLAHELDPGLRVGHFPPHDRAPYDRTAPSRARMGERMGLLRWLLDEKTPPALVFTTPGALLPRVPPRRALLEARLGLHVGDAVDLDAIERDLVRLGYVLDERVDTPGEAAIRGKVIDIFPAAAGMPCRITHEDGVIATVRSYDPDTQRTLVETDFLLIDPATEFLCEARDENAPGLFEQGLIEACPELETIFDYVPDMLVALESGAEATATAYLEQIEEGYETTVELGAIDRRESRAPEPQRAFVNETDWDRAAARAITPTDGEIPDPTPSFPTERNPETAFRKYVTERLAQGDRIVLAGSGRAHGALVRKAERVLSREAQPVASWGDVAAAFGGSLLALPLTLDRGFALGEEEIVVVAPGDLLGKTSSTGRASEPASFGDETGFAIGDAVVHQEHGICRLDGLEDVAVGADARQDVVRLSFAGGATLMLPVDELASLWPYGAGADALSLDRLDGKNWMDRRARLEQEIRASAAAMVAKLREREAQKAPKLTAPPEKFDRFIRRFPHPLTPDQERAVEETLADMASGRPMDRIVCGDVGYGKTEVALRAAAACLFAGRQVAIAAPTTVLVRQHMETFRKRFARFGIRIDQLSRLVPASEAKAVRQRLASGETRLVIGTHALAAKGVRIPDLGLLVIDEEQRFGDRHKETLRSLSPSAHVLTLTATPIPRTLQAGLLGLKSFSRIATPPAQRQAVRTFLQPFDPERVRAALSREAEHGGQSFFVCPRIEDIEPMARRLSEIAPGLDVRIAHGRMPAGEIDAVMLAFAEGEGDVLLATNIIESGLDIPRANTIVIWRPERFGLAQLHQLRGRVGRGARRGVAFLLTEPGKRRSAATDERLGAIVSLDELGAGFAVSRSDLRLRGAGELFGEEQTGHVEKIGAGLYRRLFERALRCARGEAVEEDWRPELNIDLHPGIPHEYIPEPELRLNVYAEAARVESAEDLSAFEAETADRFGPLPQAVEDLSALTLLRVRCRELGIARLDCGPKAIAASFRGDSPLLGRPVEPPMRRREDRLVLDEASTSVEEQVARATELLDRLAEGQADIGARKRRSSPPVATDRAS